jgi:preprotein translocase subunit YajC
LPVGLQGGGIQRAARDGVQVPLHARLCQRRQRQQARHPLLAQRVQVVGHGIEEAQRQALPVGPHLAGQQQSLGGRLPLVLMFVVLYFVMIRPQMKRQKEHRAMIDALAKGDEVATAGGIIGKVTRLSEGFLHIEIANNVEVQIQRSAVVQVLPKGTVK